MKEGCADGLKKWGQAGYAWLCKAEPVSGLNVGLFDNSLQYVLEGDSTPTIYIENIIALRNLQMCKKKVKLSFKIASNFPNSADGKKESQITPKWNEIISQFQIQDILQSLLYNSY